MNVLTIIPARGGSKGVPGKNLRSVGGKPLIAWSILAAQASRYAADYFVSTEDVEIAAVAREWGAEVMVRPAELAGDRTPMADVVRHAVQVREVGRERPYDHVLLLQPTAPMRQADDIDGALETLIQSNADSVVSVYRVEDAHPARMYLIKDGVLEPFCTEPSGALRQDLPAVYHRNGAIYACTRRLIVEVGRLWGGRLLPFIMPKLRSINIDDMQDLMIADWLMSRKERV